MNYQLLKEKYGTPLYIYNVDVIKKIIDGYKNSFVSKEFDTEIIYASKAFSVKEMLRLINRYDMSLDVVSIGELFTAKSIGFDMKKVYFHGNNKSKLDLEIALNENVGTIVVDNLMELEELDKIATREINILIRLNVGVEAHTHKFIVTAHIDSKFGVSYNSNDYLSMLNIIKKSKNINLVGFHAHIGSQIFDLKAYDALIEKMVGYAKDFNYPMVLNLGGGFGVKYTDEDQPIPSDIIAKYLVSKVEEISKKENVKLSKICIEPGRSIVAEAGLTLYTIGYIKQTPNKLYYFIDGGMTDNIRPALYEAKYAADIIGKENNIKNKIVTIAGKCCESGDLIIENIPLPECNEGDLLVTYSTGAYGYSMSSNYNKALTPAVVFVEDGKDKLVVKRQSYEQLLEREI